MFTVSTHELRSWPAHFTSLDMGGIQLIFLRVKKRNISKITVINSLKHCFDEDIGKEELILLKVLLWYKFLANLDISF